MSKIIFLDIDGVICTMGGFIHPDYNHPSKCWHSFHKPAIEQLNRITDKTGAQIVISSTWRNSHALKELQAFFKQAGTTGDIIDRTPNPETAPGDYEPLRGLEVNLWLAANKQVDTYVIIDDDNDFTDEQKKILLVKTTAIDGLTAKAADQAIQILGEF
jgi:hypothetical protein